MLCVIIRRAHFFYEVIILEKEFFELLTEISYGLVKKEKKYETVEKNENYSYFQQPELASSIQKMGLFMLAYEIVDEIGAPLAPKNETDAIINYFSKPLNEWPSVKNPNFHPLLVFAREEEVLVHTYDHSSAFYSSEWSQELASICRTYNDEAMQQSVYQLLVRVSSEQYTFLRQFIIEHPLLDIAVKSKFRQKGKMLKLEESFLMEFIEMAYEELPINVYGRCDFCGWTVIQGSTRKRCSDHRCENETDGFKKISNIDRQPEHLRLKLGVMKYMCLPGKDELALISYCEKLNLKSTLWPDKDRYDIKIELEDVTLAIDVKSYFSPYSLKYHIEQKGVFHSLKNDEIPILVIPNERIRKQGYIEIVKQGLAPTAKIQCLKMRDLERMLKNGGLVCRQ